MSDRTEIIVDPISVFREYNDLIELLKGARQAKRWPQIELDDRSGLQLGYTGKLESYRHPRSGRYVGRVSLPLILQTLDLALMAVRVKDLPVGMTMIESPSRLLLTTQTAAELGESGNRHR